MAKISLPSTIQDLVIKGLILGYAYAIVLSASAIVVCEIRNKNQCSDTWSSGNSTATGLITTFLAYLVQPGAKSTTTSSSRSPSNASDERA